MYVEQFQLLLKYLLRPKFYIFLYPFSSAFFRSRKHLGFLPPFPSSSSSALWQKATKLPLCDLLTPFCGWKGGKKGVWAATAYSRKPAKKKKKNALKTHKSPFSFLLRVLGFFSCFFFFFMRDLPEITSKNALESSPLFFLDAPSFPSPLFLRGKWMGKGGEIFAYHPPTELRREEEESAAAGKLCFESASNPFFRRWFPELSIGKCQSKKGTIVDFCATVSRKPKKNAVLKYI